MRDAGRWREAMQRLRDAATAAKSSKKAEMMPAFLECARSQASVGEQSGASDSSSISVCTHTSPSG